jgi:hypothetical protein
MDIVGLVKHGLALGVLLGSHKWWGRGVKCAVGCGVRRRLGQMYNSGAECHVRGRCGMVEEGCGFTLGHILNSTDVTCEDKNLISWRL